MAYMGGVTAATAAAAERRRQELLVKEEQDMTPYTQADLDSDWEFKIVRANIAVFRKPEVLNDLLEDEAQAGWVMLEKLDDSRIRFRRSRSARAGDAFLPNDVDPYRTQYSAFSAQTAVMVILVGLLVLSAFVFNLLLGQSPMLSSNAWVIVAAVGFFLIGIMAVVKRRSG